MGKKEEKVVFIDRSIGLDFEKVIAGLLRQRAIPDDRY